MDGCKKRRSEVQKILKAALIAVALVGATSAASAGCVRMNPCWYLVNHTDRLVTVQVIIPVLGTITQEVGPGMISDGLDMYAEVQGYRIQHESIKVPDPWLALAGTCVRAHYRNPPIDWVKVEGSTDGHCIAKFGAMNLRFDIEP
jgi:hypothetical protein